MELPIFSLHTVAFPDLPLPLRVFEPRYLSLLEDAATEGGGFVVVAIRQGREVGGPAEPYRVGVRVGVESQEVDADGSVALVVRGLERFALIAPLDASTLYPRWEVQPYPDEGGAGTDDVEAAVGALRRYLAASGEPGIRPVVPHDPVAASWAIAAAVPGVPAARQRLLEAPGAGERLRSARDILTLETRLLRTLGAGIAAAEEPASLN